LQLAPAPPFMLALVEPSAGSPAILRGCDRAPHLKTNHQQLALLCVWLT
jgi:hypothetical protein